jgi:hypothetical protein
MHPLLQNGEEALQQLVATLGPEALASGIELWMSANSTVTACARRATPSAH